jgi:hypothetical protein
MGILSGGMHLMRPLHGKDLECYEGEASKHDRERVANQERVEPPTR